MLGCVLGSATGQIDLRYGGFRPGPTEKFGLNDIKSLMAHFREISFVHEPRQANMGIKV